MNILKSNKILFAVTLITLLLLIATFAPVRVGAGCTSEAQQCAGCICVGVQDCACTSDGNGCQAICDDYVEECVCPEY